jgi:hypothetical protein
MVYQTERNDDNMNWPTLFVYTHFLINYSQLV